MANPTFQLSLKTKRHLLRVRQLARHAADILGFSPIDQSCFAAAVFDIACQAHGETGRAMVSFEIGETNFHVFAKPVPKPRRAKYTEEAFVHQISKPLPASPTVSRDDVPWILQQLFDRAPPDVFEEMCKLNQELLGALLELVRLGSTSADQSSGTSAA